MAGAKRTQPEWLSPEGQIEGLRLYNSMTRKKDLFVPADMNQVRWYICGPTVYDASHMGHARSYITFDIVRRVMQDYFNYRMFCVMNITDVDDKIILRARRNYLFESFVAKKPDAAEVLKDVKAAMGPFAEKAAKEEDPAKKEMLEKILKSVNEHVAKVEANQSDAAAVSALLEAARDPVSQALDKEHGAEVSDHSIFTKLSKYWEQDYMRDMDALNVLPPDCLTRVSEYVPEIVSFVEKIIANGYAYEADGSVYFSVAQFDNHDDHHYAKLVPEAVGNLAALAEGEGELGATLGKRAPQDFALWKKSKPGEPAWASPWGMGRPGWHIECSAMASDILPGQLDIHCGGIDLMFPHHDNEIAQSEAYYGCKQWVNYFLHAGHLEIEGRKMSKSLKNFITIKEALERHTARQLRLMFLCHTWTSTLDYSENTIAIAKHMEKLFTEFFLNIKAAIRETPMEYKFGEPERTLAQQIMDAQNAVHTALCDSIDTATAIKALQKLVGDVNTYLADAKKGPSIMLLRKAGDYVTRILRVFGVIPDTAGMGFPTGGTGVNVEETVMPFAQAISDFRDKVRSIALERNPKDAALLDMVGDLRDNILPELGLRVEDRQGEKAVIKLMDKDELLRERQQEREERDARERKKAEERAAREEVERQRMEAAKVPPSELFKGRLDADGQAMFSQYDERGVPTHDAAGEELSKSMKKKLEKEYETQKKAHEKYLKSAQ